MRNKCLTRLLTTMRKIKLNYRRWHHCGKINKVTKVQKEIKFFSKALKAALQLAIVSLPTRKIAAIWKICDVIVKYEWIIMKILQQSFIWNKEKQSTVKRPWERNHLQKLNLLKILNLPESSKYYWTPSSTYEKPLQM